MNIATEKINNQFKQDGSGRTLSGTFNERLGLIKLELVADPVTKVALDTLRDNNEKLLAENSRLFKETSFFNDDLKEFSRVSGDSEMVLDGKTGKPVMETQTDLDWNTTTVPVYKEGPYLELRRIDGINEARIHQLDSFTDDPLGKKVIKELGLT